MHLHANNVVASIASIATLAFVRAAQHRRSSFSNQGSTSGPRCSLQKRSLPKVSPEIQNCELIKRSFFYSQCPPEDKNKPEIAMFGRSNVGKSSMINFLCQRKLLSTISKRPGHTKLIHHFLVDKSWYLVDLPGIGFSEASKGQAKHMDQIVSAYVRHRKTLVEVLYLVDGSLPPQATDLEGIKWLVDSGVYLSIVFTKMDKDPRMETGEGSKTRADAFADALYSMEGSPWRLGRIHELPFMYCTSAKMKTGRAEVLQHIAEIRQRCLIGKQVQKKRLTGEDAKELQTTGGEKTGPPAIR